MTVDEELLAGALALITAHAEACAQRRAELAPVVGAHVLLLATDLSASLEFRRVLSVLSAHWQALAGGRYAAQAPSGDPLLWHFAPARVQ